MAETLQKYRFQTLALLLIIGIAATFRIYHLDVHSLWLDEAYSYRFSQLDWHELLFNLSHYETHSPFYYSILKLWTGAFGTSEFAIRFLSVIASVTSIPLVYLSAKLVSKDGNNIYMGLLAAFMFSLSSLQINHAQDARPYAFYTLAMAVATFCICWLWSKRYALMGSFAQIRQSEPCAILVYTGLGVSITLLQYLHNTAVIFILPIVIVLLWWWTITCCANRFVFISLALSAFCAALFYAPYLPQFIGQLGNFSDSDFWLAQPTIPYLFSSTMLLYGPEPQWLPVYLRASIYLLVILPILALSIWSFIRIHSVQLLRDNPVWLLLILAFLPWGLNLAITFQFRPIYMERVLIPVEVPWFIILSAAPFALKGARQYALVAFMAGLSLISAIGFHTHTETVPHHIERWREFSEIFVEKKETAPAIISLTDYPELPLSYYADQLGFKPRFVIVPKKEIPILSPQDAKDLVKQVKDEKVIWVAIISPYTKRPTALMDALLKTHNLTKEYSYPLSETDKGDELLEFTKKN